MVRSALSAAAFLGSPYERVLEAASQAGVQALEWSRDLGPEPGDRAAAERLAMATLRAGLATASYASLYRAGLQSQAAFDALVDTARALYSPALRLWAAGKSGAAARDSASFADEARRLADRSARHGITLCFGLGRGSALDSYERALLFMRAADHPFVKLCWEPLPGSRFDESMQAFQELSGYVGQICARSSAADGSDGLLRDRDEDWLLYMDALDEQGGAPDMARYVIIRAFKDGRPESLADDAALIGAWSTKLRRYRRRRLI